MKRFIPDGLLPALTLALVLALAGGVGATDQSLPTKSGVGDELRRLEVERTEWFKERTERFHRETGLTRKQLAKRQAILMEEVRKLGLSIKTLSGRELVARHEELRRERAVKLAELFTARQLQQIKDYEAEVLQRWQAWQKASGQERPLPRKEPGRFMDEPLRSPPGSS